MREQLEREDKWIVDDDFEMPPLGDVVRLADVGTDHVELESVYYDTAEHDLRAHGIVMRRRDCDDDTGWQVEVPTGDGRLELRWPLSDAPPDELSDVLVGVALGKPLTRTTTIRTRRERHRVTSNGELCFEVGDDHVRASTGTTPLAWREIEVELGPSTADVPKRLRRRLRTAGATRATYPSKLARATGMPSSERLPTAVAALADYLDAQIDQIVAGDVDLRRGRDPIHDTRVAIRRVRSVLRVFSRQLDDAAVSLEPDLEWFAGVLGEVRDAQVQQHRFADALDAIPDELILGPVRSRIRSELRGVELPARKAVDEAMATERYLRVLRALRQWRTEPPAAADLSTKDLRAAAGRASRKARRRLASAVDDGDPVLLHRARKAAKRARYAAELVTPVDSSAKYRATRHEGVQSVLGEHQDTVVARETLRRLATVAGTTPRENGFTFGLLYAREERIAADCRARAASIRR